MKEITRVHIAGVQYDIEVDAKKALQAYLSAIKNYTNEDDLIDDVEGRIVELLTEQGVKRDGVVTLKAIDSVIGQLGKPEDFSSDEVVLPSDGSATKKFYRDSGGAWIGGLAAGLARYFGTGVWWIRALFVVSLFLTSGFSLLVYIVLWIVIPATKTPSDVLRLQGEPVTVTNMNAQTTSNSPVRPERDQKILRVVSTALGIVLLFGAFIFVIGAALAIVRMLAGGLSVDTFTPLDIIDGQTRLWLLGFAIAAVLSGLTFTLLAAYLLITWRFRRPVVIVMIITFALTLIGAAGEISTALYGRQQIIEKVQRDTVTRTIELPSLANISSVSLNNDSTAHVVYVVTSGDKPRIETSQLKGLKAPDFTVRDGELSVTIPEEDVTGMQYGYYTGTVTIYGPAIPNLTIKKGAITLDGDGKSVDTMNVTVADNASLQSSEISIRTLNARLARYAGLSMGQSNVTDANVVADQHGSADFATVKSLVVTAPETCSEMAAASISVREITDPSYILNGKTMGLESYESSCASIMINGLSKYDD